MKTLPIDKDEKAILAVLSETGGFLTGRVAISAKIDFGHNQKTRSAFCRTKLLSLQTRGFVKTLDDEKPVCWCRTALGTEALENLT